jgi:hypothetical protein
MQIKSYHPNLRLTIATLVTFVALSDAETLFAETGTASGQGGGKPHDVASLVPIISENGQISISIDALGITGSTGTIQVEKPANATVRSAHLFAASTGFSNATLADGSITLDGVPVNWDDQVPNGILSNNYYADVTGIVKTRIDSSAPGRIDINVAENASSSTEGEILAVIFDDPSQQTQNTLLIFFGAQNTERDIFAFGLNEPIDPSDPSAFFEFSLGISFGSQPAAVAQYSEVYINGQLLSSSAGGQDDGFQSNGALITVGGLDDVITNPADPFNTGTTARYDDELYDLKSFLSGQANFIQVETTNPSRDDNVFFAAAFISVQAAGGKFEVGFPDTTRIGVEAPVSVSVPGFIQPQTSDLYYRRGGETAYQSTTLTSVEGPLVASIPSEYVTARGIEYYIRISDGLNAITIPSASPETNPAILQVLIDRLVYPQNLTARRHKMISFPVQLISRQESDVFGDDYGLYDEEPRQWRIFRWGGLGYTERFFLTTLQPGMGFWLINRSGAEFDLERVLSPSTAGPVQITLTPGWNQIGNPFPFSVPWDYITSDQPLQPPVAYNGRDWQYDIPILEAWEGYFVNNPGPTNITMQIPPIETPEGFSEFLGKETAAGFQLNLSASGKRSGLVDGHNVAGLGDSAAPGLDLLDRLEPPVIDEYLRLTFVEGKLEMARNFKPITGNGQSWRLRLGTSGFEETVRVSLEETGDLPEGFRLFLVDEDLRRVINLTGNGFETSVTKEPKYINVIIGTDEYVDAASGGLALLPSHYALAQNYPNPFNPETTIRYELPVATDVKLVLRNLLGKHVRTLVSGFKEAGVYVEQWDGRDNDGMALPSGTYFYTLKTDAFEDTKRLILLR